MSSNSKDNDSVRIILTPIKIVRDSATGQWSTPRRRNDSIQKVKYNLRVRTPSTPVVSLSSPITKKENHTPKPLTRASRQISFEKDNDEYEQEQSSSSDDDDDDDDEDEDESSSSDEEKITTSNNNIRKSNMPNKGTPATKKGGRSTFLPRVNYLTTIDRTFLSLLLFLDEYNDIIRFTK